jgi:hypothetical protein
MLSFGKLMILGNHDIPGIPDHEHDPLALVPFMIENDLVQVFLIGIFVMVNSDKRDFESAVVHLFFQLEHVVAIKRKTKIII